MLSVGGLDTPHVNLIITLVNKFNLTLQPLENKGPKNQTLNQSLSRSYSMSMCSFTCSRLSTLHDNTSQILVP